MSARSRKCWRQESGCEVGISESSPKAYHAACCRRICRCFRAASDFAYGSAVTMLNLAAQGAPVIAVATIDAQGTDAVLVNPDALSLPSTLRRPSGRSRAATTV